MDKSFLDEWIRLIRPLFPKRARIEIMSENIVTLQIDWKLGTNPMRPNKRSRLIRVVIPEEAIENCTDSKTAGIGFKKLIQDKLSIFSPDHNTRRCGRRPIEEWVVSKMDVN